MLKKGDSYEISQQVPVVDQADVLVAGGGTAGIVAALAAARNGADVLLIERSGSLGGMLTSGNAGITMYTKFSAKPEDVEEDQKTLREEPEQLQIVGGIAREIGDRLIQAGIGIGNDKACGRYVFTSPEDFRNLLFKMCEESGVRLKLHCLIVDVIRSGDEVSGVVVESKSGRQVIVAKQIVDATGDGDVAAMAGAPYSVGITSDDLCASPDNLGKMQVAGVMFRVANVDLENTLGACRKNPECFKLHHVGGFDLDAVIERFERNEMAVFLIRTRELGTLQIYNLPNPGMVTVLGPQLPDINGLDADDITKAEVIMAALLTDWMRKLRNVPGFGEAYLANIPEMGIRETRHIQGEYVLKFMDVYERREFPDCIGFGAHPIDTIPRPKWLQDPNAGLPHGWFFQIPFSILLAKNLSNLLTAGRCVSATHEARGCVRTTAQCMVTGEAAGTAAALAAKRNLKLRELPIGDLRRKLKEQNVLC